MVKAKHQKLAAITANKNNNLGTSIDSSDSGNKDFLHEDDNWIIVKRQKITILIPPLPVPLQSNPQSPRTNQTQTHSRKMVKNRIQVPSETFLHEDLGNEPKKFDSLSSKVNTQIVPKPNPSKEKLLSPCADHLDIDPVLKRRFRDRRFSKTDGVFGVSGRLYNYQKGPFLGTSNGYPLLQNQRMRVLNIERKLERVGGLSRWLVSLGLGQFVQIFRTKNVNKFQLVNLTMGKLKEMGANAVGPRRKLLHAIECLD